MGWNGWNAFGNRVDDFMVRAEADAMVTLGMQAAGYEYVIVDDGWQGVRDAQGHMHPNPAKFPDMKALADYVHHKGLKFGIYSSPGPTTCANFQGSYQHEAEDAETFAGWGVDYLKYDWCGAGDVYSVSDMPMVYRKMGDILRHASRPIVYSICQYGAGEVWRWGASTGAELWRTTMDTSPSFSRISFLASIQVGLEKYAGPGHWNDPDMLEVGNGELSDDEGRVQMTFWSLLAAPLIAGNDVTRMRSNVAAILTDREVIAVDQDPLGRQGSRVSQEGPLEIWARPLAGGGEAVGLFNLGEGDVQMTLRLADVGSHRPARVRDLWSKQDLGVVHDSLTTDVREHGVVLLVLR
jgi:alpha-galactosidase